MKIGVRLESFGLPLKKALLEAERLGVRGVMIDAVRDLSPANLSQSGQREFRRLLQVRDLELTALNCPLRYGLDTPENLEPRIEHIKQVMSLAYNLGPGIVTIAAGSVDIPEDDPRRNFLKESLAALGAYGDRIGTTLALETGLESGETLANFLSQFDTGSLAVNFDPANLFLSGFKPIEDLRALAGKIVHVQAKDARRHASSRAAQEVPLGYGELDWMHMTQFLDDMEYRGYVVVVRDVGTRRVQEVEEGVGFLRRFIR